MSDTIAKDMYELSIMQTRMIGDVFETHNMWELLAVSVCRGITGGMAGGSGNPIELADYYLSNTAELLVDEVCGIYVVYG